MILKALERKNITLNPDELKIIDSFPKTKSIYIKETEIDKIKVDCLDNEHKEIQINIANDVPIIIKNNDNTVLSDEEIKKVVVLIKDYTQGTGKIILINDYPELKLTYPPSPVNKTK